MQLFTKEKHCRVLELMMDETTAGVPTLDSGQPVSQERMNETTTE